MHFTSWLARRGKRENSKRVKFLSFIDNLRKIAPHAQGRENDKIWLLFQAGTLQIQQGCISGLGHTPQGAQECEVGGGEGDRRWCGKSSSHLRWGPKNERGKASRKIMGRRWGEEGGSRAIRVVTRPREPGWRWGFGEREKKKYTRAFRGGRREAYAQLKGKRGEAAPRKGGARRGGGEASGPRKDVERVVGSTQFEGAFPPGREGCNGVWGERGHKKGQHPSAGSLGRARPTSRAERARGDGRRR
jgi:hypothetical protein